MPILNYNIHSSKFSIVPKAISYGGSTVDFLTESTTGGRISKYQRQEGKTYEKVQSVTLSEILKTNDIDGKFSLISDIEGAEYDLLINEPDSLKMCEILVMEIEDLKNASIQEQVDLVCQIGFKMVKKDGNVFAFRK